MAIYFYADTLQYIEVSARTWPVYSTFFIFIIGIGLLTFIVGFFGCCGACKESSCMLCLYFTIIIAICGIIGALIFLPDKFEIKPQQVKSDLQHDIKEIIQRSYSRYNTSSFANMVIDRIQEDFQCCGSNNFTDWYASLQNNFTRPDIGVAGSAMNSYIVANSNTNQMQPMTNIPRQFAPQSQKQIYQQDQQQAGGGGGNSYPQSPVVTAPFRVPVSCCSARSGNQNAYLQCKSMIAKYDANPNEQQIQRIPNVNQDGCVEKIYHYLFVVNWWPLNIIGGLAIGLQGLSLIFSLCLCCAINRAIDDYDDDEDKHI